mgnify:CR=1 FL=1
MRYLLLSIGQSLGIVFLAVLGVILGRWFARLRGRVWLLGYAIPMVFVGIIAVPRWLPRIEQIVPFKWIMADRTEFALAAFLCTMFLSTPMYRLKQKRQRFAVILFMLFFTVRYSLLPFLSPAFEYSYLSGLQTKIDSNGVCLQSNGYNCGPAAAVTVLRRIGINAEEGDLAVQAHTTLFAGTPNDSLCLAIHRQYGAECRILYDQDIEGLKGKEPFIAVVKFGFLVDHYVAVLAVNDEDITLGDPLSGMLKCTHEEFEKKWRRQVILVE